MTWPAYASSEIVTCFVCDGDLGPANDAETTIMIGEGNGNRLKTCPTCGYRNFYDCHRGQKANAEQMEIYQRNSHERRLLTLNWLDKHGNAETGKHAAVALKRLKSAAPPPPKPKSQASTGLFANLPPV